MTLSKPTNKISTNKVTFHLIRSATRALTQRFQHIGLLLLTATPSVWADAELVNSKSGISLEYSGTRGTDYAEEYLYFDKWIGPHKVIYIKDTTELTLSHNSNNIIGASDDRYIPAVPSTLGNIKYKIDGDEFYGVLVQDWISYTAPIAFKDLNYGWYGDAGVGVVGTTGSSDGQPRTRENRETRYFRGVVDSVGDEWHLITVADDDLGISANTGDKEYAASDSKVFQFVVNPKTPCLTWRVTGKGQFYTTPAKKYFLPHIYKQTTYLNPGAGTVTCEIRDINGNNVYYRINGGSFTDAGSSSVTLDHDDFNTGENTLEYYYAGNAVHTKTRTVIKNPAYPSANEVHGDRLWINAKAWETHLQAKVASDWWMNQWKNTEKFNNHAAINSKRGTGARVLSGEAYNNAIVARTLGMKYTSLMSGLSAYTYADFAKWALLEAHTILDPVGVEFRTANLPNPTRELHYRGYWDAVPIYRHAAAYDVLIGYYRADQGHVNGITAIEDHFIRDSFARYMHYLGMYSGGYESKRVFNSGGMWDVAIKTGGTFITCMMPGYSTEYYGTSGMDGNKKTWDTPLFPTTKYTWLDIYVLNKHNPKGYPDLDNHFGIEEYWFNAEGNWHDRIPYIRTLQCGYNLGVWKNLLAIFANEVPTPRTNLAMQRTANGQLYGLKISQTGDENPDAYNWGWLLNSWHPEFRSSPAYARIIAAGNTDSESDNKLLESGQALAVIWFDHTLPFGVPYASSNPSVDAPLPPSGLRIVPAVSDSN